MKIVLLRACLIYARVSTVRQEQEGYSLDAQLEMCRAWAKTHGYSVVEEFVEVQSASSPGRPRFLAMVDKLKRTPGLAVVAQDTTRLGRNMDDGADLDRTRAPVFLVMEGGADEGETATGRLMRRFKRSIAAYSSERLQEETRKGMRKKASLGLYPSVAPVGYKNVERAGVKVIEPDADLAPLIRDLFIRCAQGASLDELRTWAKAAGLRKPGTLGSLSRSRIAGVLGSRVYHGVVDWGGEIHQGKHRAIVTEAEWQAAKDALVSRRGRSPKSKLREHLYGGKLIRSACGAWIVGETKTQRHGYRYTYYHCSGSCGERHAYLREESLEGMLVESLRSLRLPPLVVDAIKAEVRAIAMAETKDARSAAARLRSRIAQLEDREARSYQAYLDGLTDAKGHQDTTTRARAERQAAESELAQVKTLQAADADTAVGLIEIAQGAADILPKLSREVRRELLRFYTSELVLERDAGSILVKWATPWDALNRTREIGQGTGLRLLPGAQDGTWLPRQDANRTQDQHPWPIRGLLMARPGAWFKPVLELLRVA